LRDATHSAQNLRTQDFKGRSVRFPSLPCVILLSSALLAHAFPQQPAPSVPEVLTRLQESVSSYLSSVPSFFADERVSSNLYQPNDVKITTVTDSVFRIRRTGEGNATQLVESREIKAVNHKPAKGENMTGPTAFRGAFTNGVLLVSPVFAPCYEFQREPDAKVEHINAIVLSYKTLSESLLDRNCPKVREGKVFIDPQNFRLLRVEARVPNHEITAGVFGLWTWSINYAPVVLDGRTFWMPKTIESEAIPSDRHAAWSFVAKYSNYHKLEVTSHIITDVGSNPPPPPQ
jgi:hypothetical protein